MKTNHLIHIFLYLIRIYGTNYRKLLYSHGKRISLSCERLKMFSRSFRRISNSPAVSIRIYNSRKKQFKEECSKHKFKWQPSQNTYTSQHLPSLTG